MSPFVDTIRLRSIHVYAGKQLNLNEASAGAADLFANRTTVCNTPVSVRSVFYAFSDIAEQYFINILIQSLIFHFLFLSSISRCIFYCCANFPIYPRTIYITCTFELLRLKCFFPSRRNKKDDATQTKESL